MLYGTGKGRVASYAGFAFKIIELANQGKMLSDKSMDKWSKEDADLLAKSVIEKNCSSSTKHLFVLTLKRLVHSAKHGVIIEKDGIETARAGTCLDTIGSKCRRAYTEVLTFVNPVLKIGEKVLGSSGAVAAKMVSITTIPRVMLPTGFVKV